MRKQSGNRQRVALFIPFHFPIGGLGLGATRIRDTSKHFDFLKFSLTFSFPKSKYFIQFPPIQQLRWNPEFNKQRFLKFILFVFISYFYKYLLISISNLLFL